MSKEKISISSEVNIALVKAGVKTQILQNDIVQQLSTLERGDKVIITKLFIEVIAQYVERLDFNKDTIFGIFNDELRLIGMAHLAYLPETTGLPRAAEFGVSVLPEGRDQGLGTALLKRSAVHSRNTRIETLYVHCLVSNKAMLHLAQKADMQVEYAYGDADAYLKLLPASPATIVEEAANEQWADLDYAMKSNLKQSQQAWWWFLGRPKLTI
jgi:RimJ/RimL family protein N-acetyltransferase